MTGVSADDDVPLPPLSEPSAASPAHLASSDPQLQGSFFAFVWFDSRIGGILWSLHFCSCAVTFLPSCDCNMGCNKQRAVCSELVTSKRLISEIDADIDEEWEVCVELKKCCPTSTMICTSSATVNERSGAARWRRISSTYAWEEETPWCVVRVLLMGVHEDEHREWLSRG